MFWSLIRGIILLPGMALGVIPVIITWLKALAARLKIIVRSGNRPYIKSEEAYF
ncbi:MAG: hypothetical protein KAT01_08765 [Candidatus Aminicenantes bacterium]|nr:hypothetical protein [Candidatus Aminicenantes bacterium]